MSSFIRKKAPLWPPFKDKYKKLNDDHQDQIPLKNNYSAVVAPSPYVESPELLRTPAIQPPPSRKWKTKGWRGGVRIAFHSALTVLVFNVILMVVCTTTLEWMDGMTMVYRGPCDDVERVNNWVHLAVNLLSTCLLAGSNYCMQVLSAPTRADVDKAHARGHWLDIGLPSLRNLRSLKKNKIALWWILALSSIPLHLFYNSVFFSAIATNDYNVLYATEAFTQGAAYNKTRFPDTRDLNVTNTQILLRNNQTFQRLERSDCVRKYGVDFVTDRKDVIVVIRNNGTFNNSSLQKVVTNELPDQGFVPGYDAFHWICDDPSTVAKTNGCCKNSFGFIPCQSMVGKLEQIADTWWNSAGYRIDYCLSQVVEAQCHEHFSPTVMAPVLFFNIFKTLVMWYVAYRYKDKPLVTVGDAVESFITNPDPTTKGMCLANKEMIERYWQNGYVSQPLVFDGIRQRWWRSVSRRQWMFLVFLLTTVAAIVGVGLGYGITTLQPATFANAWSLGLGTVRQQNLITGLKIPGLGANAVFVSAIIANTPQALFSFIYLVYNTIFSTMFLGREWDRFGTHEKGRIIRVSEPKGPQRSTYFLQVPFRYAIVLLSVSGITHWLVSQSIFLANILILPLNGEIPKQDEITTCAYSPQGMVFLLMIGVVMLSWLAIHGFRQYSGRMIIVGSCSAAISAACHVKNKSQSEREEMIFRPMRWGATDFGSRKSTFPNNSSNRSETGSSILDTPGLPSPSASTSLSLSDNSSPPQIYTPQSTDYAFDRGRPAPTPPPPHYNYNNISNTFTAPPSSTTGSLAKHLNTLRSPPLPSSSSIPFIPPTATGKGASSHQTSISIHKARFREMDLDSESDVEARYDVVNSRLEREMDMDMQDEAAYSVHQIGHCTFSDGVVGRPVVGRRYA